MTNTALKEWAVVIDALIAGDTILLLRKGGIRESRFTVPHDRILLYPTYEHQRSHLLKSGFRALTPAPSTQQVTLSAWAQITDIFQVSETEQLWSLMPHHIWTEPFVSERFRWKPQQPLSVLLLRTYVLKQPVTIPYQETYGGCRSWIQVDCSIELDAAKPVLPQDEYELRSQRILQAIQTET